MLQRDPPPVHRRVGAVATAVRGDCRPVGAELHVGPGICAIDARNGGHVQHLPAGMESRQTGVLHGQHQLAHEPQQGMGVAASGYLLPAPASDRPAIPSHSCIVEISPSWTQGELGRKAWIRIRRRTECNTRLNVPPPHRSVLCAVSVASNPSGCELPRMVPETPPRSGGPVPHLRLRPSSQQGPMPRVRKADRAKRCASRKIKNFKLTHYLPFQSVVCP
jgi:hypothetical protein